MVLRRLAWPLLSVLLHSRAAAAILVHQPDDRSLPLQRLPLQRGPGEDGAHATEAMLVRQPNSSSESTGWQASLPGLGEGEMHAKGAEDWPSAYAKQVDDDKIFKDMLAAMAAEPPMHMPNTPAGLASAMEAPAQTLNRNGGERVIPLDSFEAAQELRRAAGSAPPVGGLPPPAYPFVPAGQPPLGPWPPMGGLPTHAGLPTVRFPLPQLPPRGLPMGGFPRPGGQSVGMFPKPGDPHQIANWKGLPPYSYHGQPWIKFPVGHPPSTLPYAQIIQTPQIPAGSYPTAPYPQAPQIPAGSFPSVAFPLQPDLQDPIGAPLVPKTPAPAPALKILAFGDSWAEMGPSYHMLEDMFARKGVDAMVRSVARSGSRACQWAANENNLRDAASQQFGNEGADYIWYSLGGNDYLSDHYTECSNKAHSYAEAYACVQASTKIVVECTDRLFQRLWERFPNTKILQCGYDFACDAPPCGPILDAVYCKGERKCLNKLTVEWQDILMPPRIWERRYTGINILGTLQYAKHMVGASPGHPLMYRGSPCTLTETCVHPRANSAASDAIGEAFWNMYFSRFHAAGPPKQVPPRQTILPPRGNEQGNLERNLAICLWDWVPSISSPSGPPPCSQEWKAFTQLPDEAWNALVA